jgi:hypothetical protein
MRADSVAAIAVAALVAINLATTGRWAAVPGAMTGWRLPLILVGILVLIAATLGARSAGWSAPRWLARAVLWSGGGLLAAMCFGWFPLSSWPLIPFLDDWPPRYGSTVDAVALLRRGAFYGWQWNYLGGYSTSTDITQNLAVMGFIPMTLLGDAVGFHVLHLLLFLAVPTLVFFDLRRSDRRPVATLAGGLAAVAACGLSMSVVRSGDTNSLAGLVSVLGVLWASHRARGPSRYGFSILAVALTVAACSHAGFFAYAVVLLALEAIYCRDGRHAARAGVAATAAIGLSLPLTYELFRYPAQFNFNNVVYDRITAVDWPHVLRTIGYNVEILLSPHRWFSDVARLFVPLLVIAAWRREGRVGFYAWGALGAMGLALLNVPQAGYAFARAHYLMLALAPPVIAWHVLTRSRSSLQAGALLALAILCQPIAWIRVPHQPSVDAFVPFLVDRLRNLDGHLVLLENNPHRDVDAADERVSEPSLYGTHYEALVAATTGKRLYAGYWDGWQWTPFRGEMLAAGAWQGRRIDDGDHDRFLAELRRWGIRHLLVWSVTAKTRFGAWPELARRWEHGPWTHFEFLGPDVDTRSVATTTGRAELVSTDPFGGLVRLTDVAAGDRVIVRTHYHPGWGATASGRPLPVGDVGGQLGFVAPAAGTYDVALSFASGRRLLPLAAAGLVILFGVDWLRTRRPLSKSGSELL